MNKIEHLSASSISMYLRCPMQFYFRYILGLKIPTAAMLILGRAYHKALEVNFKQKIKTFKDMPVQDLQDIYRTDFTYRKDNEDIEWKEEKPEQMIDVGTKLVELYRNEKAPLIQPIEVEKWITIPVKNIPIKGRIDLITKKNIIDHKTSSRKKILDPTDIQASIYSIARPNLKFIYQVAVKTKKPYIQEDLEVPVSEYDKLFVKSMILRITQAIQTGVFVPNPTGWWCSRNFCGYYDRCKKLITKSYMIQKKGENENG